MPAVLYGGKAFTVDGKLYVSDVCPPCCDPCVCPEGSEYTTPKRITDLTLEVSGIVDTFNEIAGGNSISISGISALNGTYNATLVTKADHSIACPSYSPASCPLDDEEYANCVWLLRVPWVQISGTYVRGNGPDPATYNLDGTATISLDVSSPQNFRVTLRAGLTRTPLAGFDDYRNYQASLTADGVGIALSAGGFDGHFRDDCATLVAAHNRQNASYPALWSVPPITIVNHNLYAGTAGNIHSYTPGSSDIHEIPTVTCSDAVTSSLTLPHGNSIAATQCAGTSSGVSYDTPAIAGTFLMDATIAP